MITEVVGKEIEKIKGYFESYLNGLNMVGAISYSQYSALYDEGTKQIQKAYELGKSELEKEIDVIRIKADAAIADKLLITAKYNEILNDLNQANDKLQKENAKLEHTVSELLNDTTYNQKVNEQLAKENAELKGRNKAIETTLELHSKLMKSKLFEANKIIRKLLSFTPKENIEGVYEVASEAEEFLSSLVFLNK